MKNFLKKLAYFDGSKYLLKAIGQNIIPESEYKKIEDEIVFTAAGAKQYLKDFHNVPEFTLQIILAKTISDQDKMEFGTSEKTVTEYLSEEGFPFSKNIIDQVLVREGLLETNEPVASSSTPSKSQQTQTVSNAKVKEIQMALNDLELVLPEEESFMPDSAKIYGPFSSSWGGWSGYGVKPDGMLGPQTQAAIDAFKQKYPGSYPNYDYLLKVIRDRIAYEKTLERKEKHMLKSE